MANQDSNGTDAIVQILLQHWGRPYVEEGYALVVDCMAEGCGFRSKHADPADDNAIWADHARHVADVMAQADIGHVAASIAAERLRLADKLDEEVHLRQTQPWLRWSDDTNLGWTQAANHLRHPTATN